jgi:hypothetical protein
MEEPVTTVFEELEPPDLPQDAVYTSCYCEENVYLLCQRFLSLPNITENWHIWTVFISNVDKKVGHSVGFSGKSLGLGQSKGEKEISYCP